MTFISFFSKNKNHSVLAYNPSQADGGVKHHQLVTKKKETREGETIGEDIRELVISGPIVH